MHDLLILDQPSLTGAANLIQLGLNVGEVANTISLSIQTDFVLNFLTPENWQSGLFTIKFVA